MELRRILLGAFHLLKSKPKVFIPRLITTIIYTFFTLYLMDLASDFLLVKDPHMVSAFMWKLTFLFAVLPVIYFIDILTYAMYPRIVSDYEARRSVSLIRALKDGLGAWRVVVALAFAVFSFLILISVAVGLMQVITYITGNPIFTVLSALLALSLILTFSIMVFFVIPKAVLDGSGVADSFRESYRLGIKHRGTLLKLNLLFALLVSATMILVLKAELTDSNPASSIIFILVRLVQSVVYTYVVLTNPLAYLNVRVKNPSGK